MKKVWLLSWLGPRAPPGLEAVRRQSHNGERSLLWQAQQEIPLTAYVQPPCPLDSGARTQCWCGLHMVWLATLQWPMTASNFVARTPSLAKAGTILSHQIPGAMKPGHGAWQWSQRWQCHDGNPKGLSQSLISTKLCPLVFVLCLHNLCIHRHTHACIHRHTHVHTT